MNGDELNFFEWAFRLAVGALFAVGWWMWCNLVKVVQETKKDITDHKLHVSEIYAKKTELDPIYSKLDEVGKDIKILLGRKQERDS